jgi:glycosyltransferase involved in cell wall biosynthesis
MSGTVDEVGAVSAVIPTVGRPERLARAVRSVLAQTRPVAEVVVVHDGADAADLAALSRIDDRRIRVLTTSRPGRGPGHARNTGIAAATGDWIALLDDDDEWSPRKIEHQLAVVRGRADRERVVIAGRVERISPEGRRIWPTRPIGATERVADYLFVRRSPGEGWLPTPALVVPRRLALAIPFPEGSRHHEDYAWLLDLEAHGARFVVVDECVGRVHVGDRSSLSASAQWTDSLDWARALRHRLGPRAFSAFCLTETSRHARLAPGARGMLPILVTALRGRPRGRDLAQFAATWALPLSWHGPVSALRGPRSTRPASTGRRDR